MSEPTAVEILACAKILAVEGPGWCKRHYAREDGACCAAGLIALAAGDEDYPQSPEALQASEACYEQISTLSVSLTLFNDRASTRRKDVLRMFDRAIRTLGAGA